jgi:hypothetical protein
MADILSVVLSSAKFVPKCYELLKQRRFRDEIEEMRSAAAKSPSTLNWRAEPGTEEHKKFERMVNAKLLVRSPMFPNSYQLPLTLFSLFAQVGLRPLSVLLHAPAYGDLFFFLR